MDVCGEGKLGGEDDEGWQVIVHRPQTVGYPRTHGRFARIHVSRVRKKDRGFVVDRIGMHRSDDGEFIGHLAGVRQQVADPMS